MKKKSVNNDINFSFRIASQLKEEFMKICEKEGANASDIIRDSIKKYIKKADVKMDNNELIISNWREEVCQDIDIVDLEKDLNERGWLDENKNLVLFKKWKDTEKFWDRYSLAFHEEILEYVED